MLLSTAVSVIMGFWALVYLIDVLFKAYWPETYLRVLERTGVVTTVAQVRWYTQMFNSLFQRAGQAASDHLRTWFNIGIACTLFTMVASIILLSVMLQKAIFTQRKPAIPGGKVDTPVLSPVVPGVNLPMNQILYYLLTLLLCGIVHELGHALAAVRENVRINGFGFFVFLLYPGAFVDLYSDHLQVISPVRRLRIYCAGVWHNIVIVLLAVLCLYSFPIILIPGYIAGDAVVVTSIQENSPVSGRGGLVIGSRISNINGCSITHITSWNNCIAASVRQANHGYCMPMEQILTLDASTVKYETPQGKAECCSNSSLASRLCFQYIKQGKEAVQYACLTARIVTSMPMCKHSENCYSYGEEEVACILPSLDNSTRLLRIVQQDREPVLFVGNPIELLYSVSVSNFVPRFPFVPVTFPYMLETFCKYLVSLSGALAILNVIPCYALDGQWILLALVELTCQPFSKNKDIQSLLFSVILLCGTLLLSLNIVFAIWQAAIWH